MATAQYQCGDRGGHDEGDGGGEQHRGDDGLLVGAGAVGRALVNHDGVLGRCVGVGDGRDEIGVHGETYSGVDGFCALGWVLVYCFPGLSCLLSMSVFGIADGANITISYQPVYEGAVERQLEYCLFLTFLLQST